MTNTDGLWQLWLKNEINSNQFMLAEEALNSGHREAYPRLQSPDTAYGPAALVQGVFQSLRWGVDAAVLNKLVEIQLVANGDLSEVSKWRTAHDVTVAAESFYSPFNWTPGELAAKTERFLKDPEPRLAYKQVIDPSYQGQPVIYVLPSLTEELRKSADAMSPASAALAEHAVVAYDASIDLVLTFVTPEMFFVKGGAYVDDLARLGRFADHVTLVDNGLEKLFHSEPGFITSYVSGTLTKEQFEQIQILMKGHPSLQRAGFSEGLQWIDVGASVDKYLPDRHAILLTASDTSSVPRGVMAEELKHAIEHASGYHNPWRTAANRRKNPFTYNDVWHERVFREIADELDSSSTTVFDFFLDPNDAAGFRNAADAMRERARETLRRKGLAE